MAEHKAAAKTTPEAAPEAAEEALHSDALVSADELRRYTSAMKSAEREQERKREAAEEAARQDYIKALQKPPKLTEAHLQKAMHRLKEAAARGEQTVQVFRFPVELCTDDGRAINNAEPGWEQTLTGVPKAIYDFWQKHLRDRGYHLSAEVIEFKGPDRIPHDIGMFISW